MKHLATVAIILALIGLWAVGTRREWFAAPYGYAAIACLGFALLIYLIGSF